MSLNGIMGIGISSFGVQDKRAEIAREDHGAQSSTALTPDNLSAVQEDYVTLNSGVGQVAPARGAGMESLGAIERGSMFRAIA